MKLAGLFRKEAAKPLRLCPIRAEEKKGGEMLTERESAQDKQVDTEQQGGPPTVAIVAITSIVLVLGAVAYLIPGGPTEWVKWIEEQIESAGPLAPIYFAAAYCLTTVAFIPASILTLAAGYIFGPLLGTAVVSVSSTSGAALAFLISRYAARPFVEERLAKYDRFVAVDKAISREGWKVVVLLRLSPLFPFALSNYALGLTRIEFVPFVASSWIGMLPATFAYVYLGSAGKATVDIVASGGAVAKTSPLQLGLYALGAVATLGVTTLVSRIASKALSEAEGGTEED
ncbi:hypothetical protein KFL_001810060 [Klebsormidium nitens]|uniref:VTT domain-containing protein n=1 Tax=Klebsormidium nitens TaxID=105231 RepID=A0A1Y1HZZ1_KLENI|nr:hypothetical protein KFL_001810060 [Klebsormidium nitens]|eukprot:GAQ84225.1 hypothetical protein KFL_001810060 [Klebsormidium nitens]